MLNSIDAQTYIPTNSKLYTFYPHRESPYQIETIAKGTFDDLEFCPAFRFRDNDKVAVQSLFRFDDVVLAFLAKRSPNGCATIEDKKHRFVCYLLETTLQLCLAPDDDLSENPGCECFSMVRDCGMVNERDMADYLQQDSIEVLNVVG